jgi:hypothetical protein
VYKIPNTLTNDLWGNTWSKVCGYSKTIVTDLPYWIVFSSETQTITSSPQTYEDHETAGNVGIGITITRSSLRTDCNSSPEIITTV